MSERESTHEIAERTAAVAPDGQVDTSAAVSKAVEVTTEAPECDADEGGEPRQLKPDGR